MYSIYDLSNKNLSALPDDLKENDSQPQQENNPIRRCNHLDLSENKLSTLPAWFFATDWIDNISTLDLSRNKFFDIPNCIANLENLKYLDLSFNRMETFPLVLVNCQKLISLNLSNNRIVSLSSCISQLQALKELDVSNNCLSSLPPSMVELSMLDSLYIQNNKFMNSNHDHILNELMNRRSGQLKVYHIDPVVRRTIKDRVRYKQDRIAALIELVRSEIRFNELLNILIMQYYWPLVHKQNTESALLNFSSVANISDEMRRAMFPPGLHSIASIHGELSNTLQQNINVENEDELVESMVGDIFLERSSFFKIYTNYVCGYNIAQQILTHNIQSNDKFAKIIEMGQLLPDANGTSLPSLLITPISRISSYLLMLKNILRATDPFHPGYLQLEKAVNAMSNIAHYLNKKMKEAENTRKLMDIQQELNCGPLVAPHRIFVREGKILGKKGQVKIHLFNDLLILTEFKPLHALFGHTVRQLELKDIEVTNGTSDTKFDVIVKDRSEDYQLRVDNASSRDEWVNLINKYREACTHHETIY